MNAVNFSNAAAVRKIAVNCGNLFFKYIPAGGVDIVVRAELTGEVVVANDVLGADRVCIHEVRDEVSECGDRFFGELAGGIGVADFDMDSTVIIIGGGVSDFVIGNYAYDIAVDADYVLCGGPGIWAATFKNAGCDIGVIACERIGVGTGLSGIVYTNAFWRTFSPGAVIVVYRD